MAAIMAKSVGRKDKTATTPKKGMKFGGSWRVASLTVSATSLPASFTFWTPPYRRAVVVEACG